MATNKNSGIQSLNTGLSIVEAVKNSGQPLKFTDIQKLTNINKSNLYKYLHTLIELKLLYRNKADGTYTLGSKLIEYGMAAIGQEDIVARVDPYLLELNQDSRCTSLFVSWTPDGPIVVRISSELRGLNIGAQIGTSLPLTSSSGKVFYTFMPADVTKDWVEAGCADLSDEEERSLDQERHFIMENNIAFAEEPLVPSVSSAAVPLFNFKKELVGAIAIVGFNSFIPTHIDDELSAKLINISREISSSFGYNE